jgi:uncharacterized protein YoxC
MAQLPGAVVTNRETGVTLSGTFSGDGSELTNLPANTALLNSIQALTQELSDKDAQIQEMKQSIAELQAAVAQLTQSQGDLVASRSPPK